MTPYDDFELLDAIAIAEIALGRHDFERWLAGPLPQVAFAVATLSGAQIQCPRHPRLSRTCRDCTLNLWKFDARARARGGDDDGPTRNSGRGESGRGWA